MVQALLEEVTINPTIEPPELTQNRGKQTLGGHKQNLVCPRTQEKGAVTPQETDPDLPVRVQESTSQSCVSSGSSVVGLMVISSKRAYAIPKSAAPRAAAPAAVHG